jgi:hypothetical protein
VFLFAVVVVAALLTEESLYRRGGRLMMQRTNDEPHPLVRPRVLRLAGILIAADIVLYSLPWRVTR